VCHRTWRWESQKYPCWRRPRFLFCQCWARAPWNVCSCGICLAGTVDIQLCLKWEQCHQHNHNNEGPELNLRQHLSARSRICQCRWYKGNTEGDSEAALFQAFVGRNLLGSFVAINKKVEASCVHGLDDISQILWSLNFLQVSPKLLSWNTVVGSKEVQKGSEHLHFFLQ